VCAKVRLTVNVYKVQNLSFIVLYVFCSNCYSLYQIFGDVR